MMAQLNSINAKQTVHQHQRARHLSVGLNIKHPAGMRHHKISDVKPEKWHHGDHETVDQTTSSNLKRALSATGRTAISGVQ